MEWTRWAACFALLAAVYAYGFALRAVEWPYWTAANYTIGGEVMLPTNDAYFELVMADGGRSREASSVLGGMLALGRELTGWPLGNVGFFLPLLLAPLAALPPMWLLWRYGCRAGALAAGMFIASCPTYLGRTRLGCLDTDVLTLFFPLLLASCLACLVEKTGQAEGKAADGDAAAWRHGVRRQIAAFATGLAAWAYMAFYPSGGKIVLVLIASAALIACLTQRRRPIAAMLEFGLLALAAYSPAPGLAGAAALAVITRKPGVRRRLERWNEAVPLFRLALCLAPIMLYVLYPYARKLLDMVILYIANDPAMGEEAVTFGLNTPNTYALISEVRAVGWGELRAVITLSLAAFLLALAGIAVAAARRPHLLVFLPIAGLGAASTILGVRFAMYGAAFGVFLGLIPDLIPAMIQGMFRPRAARVTGEERLRIVRRGANWGLCLILCGMMAVPTLRSMRAVRPGAFFSPAFGRALQSLDQRLPPGCVLWLWWDYGFTAQYLARRDTVADSHRNGFDDTYLPGLAMSTASPLQGSRVMRFVGGLARPVKHIAGTKHIVYNSSAAMSQLAGMGHEKAVDLLESFKNSPPPPSSSGPGAPEQYAVVSWEGLKHLYHMSAIGLWNLRKGASHKYKLILLRKENMTRLEDGQVMVGKAALPMRLGGASVFRADGTVTNTDYNNDSTMCALWAPSANEGFLLHKDMYDSVFVRLLRWSRSDPPVPGFAVAVDRGPLMRVFKSVESGGTE